MTTTIRPFRFEEHITQELTNAQLAYLEERNKMNNIVTPETIADQSKNFDTIPIPEEILDAALLLGDYFAQNNIVSWELCNVCSRNFADKVRVYEDLFKFKKLNGPPTSLTTINNIHPSISDKEASGK